MTVEVTRTNTAPFSDSLHPPFPLLFSDRVLVKTSDMYQKLPEGEKAQVTEIDTGVKNKWVFAWLEKEVEVEALVAKGKEKLKQKINKSGCVLTCSNAPECHFLCSNSSKGFSFRGRCPMAQLGALCGPRTHGFVGCIPAHAEGGT